MAGFVETEFQRYRTVEEQMVALIEINATGIRVLLFGGKFFCKVSAASRGGR